MNPTPSKFDLLALCQAPWASNAPAWPEEPENDAMARGNEIHALAEAIITEAGENPDPYGIRASLAGLHNVEAEVAIAWDYTTGAARRLASTGRDYADARPTEITMTLDVVARAADGTLVVRDWKTGRGAREKSAATAMQLAGYAVGAAALYGASEVRVEFAHIGEVAPVELDSALLGPLDLAQIAGEISRLVRRTRDAKPSPGAHCDGEYCPLRGVCSARRAQALQIAPTFDVTAPIETEEQARTAYWALKAVDAVAKDVKRRLDMYASRTSVDLGDGTVYGLVHVPGREKVLVTPESAELIPPEAIERTTSKAAIERAGAKHIFPKLREIGAIVVGAPHDEMKVRKA